MFEKIETLLRQLVNNFDEIPAERKVILQKLSVYLKEKMLANEEINLVYILAIIGMKQNPKTNWGKRK